MKLGCNSINAIHDLSKATFETLLDKLSGDLELIVDDDDDDDDDDVDVETSGETTKQQIKSEGQLTSQFLQEYGGKYVLPFYIKFF